MKPCLVSSEMALNGTSFEFSLRLAQNGTSLEFSLWLALNGTYFDFLYYLFLFGKGGGQPFPDFVWNSLAGQLGQVVLYILPTQSQHFSKSRKSFFFSFQIVFFIIFPGVFSSYRIFLSSFRVFYHLSGSFYHLPVFIYHLSGYFFDPLSGFFYHLSGSFFKTCSPRKWSECFVFYVNK